MHRTDRTAYVERKPNTRVKKMKPPISPARKASRTRPARVINENLVKSFLDEKVTNQHIIMKTALQIQLMKRTSVRYHQDCVRREESQHEDEDDVEIR